MLGVPPPPPQPIKTIGIPTMPWASLPKAPGSFNEFSSSSKNLMSDLLSLPGHAGVNQQTVQWPGPVIHWLQNYKDSALGPRLLFKPHRLTCHSWRKMTYLVNNFTCSPWPPTGTGRCTLLDQAYLLESSYNMTHNWENKAPCMDLCPIQCSQDWLRIHYNHDNEWMTVRLKIMPYTTSSKVIIMQATLILIHINSSLYLLKLSVCTSSSA